MMVYDDGSPHPRSSHFFFFFSLLQRTFPFMKGFRYCFTLTSFDMSKQASNIYHSLSSINHLDHGPNLSCSLFPQSTSTINQHPKKLRRVIFNCITKLIENLLLSGIDLSDRNNTFNKLLRTRSWLHVPNLFQTS